jgi:DNA-binding transcriptional regulator YiaG
MDQATIVGRESTMPNHPNRGYRRTDASTPKADELREFRRVHGLSTKDAGELVHVTAAAWERWEAGERPMHPAFFELARLKVRLIE